MRPVLKTVGLRLAVMASLLCLVALAVFSLIPFDKPLFVAMLLAYSLPAPTLSPCTPTPAGDGEYISTALSMQTLVSIALYIAVAAYSLA
jgi:hypothetical protein